MEERTPERPKITININSQHHSYDPRDKTHGNVNFHNINTNIINNNNHPLPSKLASLFDNKPKEETMRVSLDSFFAVPDHVRQKDRLRFMLLRSLRSHSLTKLVGPIRYTDQRFPEMTREDFEKNYFIKHKVSLILTQFESTSHLKTCKDFQDEMLSDVVAFVVQCLDTEKFVVGHAFGDPTRLKSNTVKRVLEPAPLPSNLESDTDTDTPSKQLNITAAENTTNTNTTTTNPASVCYKSFLAGFFRVLKTIAPASKHQTTADDTTTDQDDIMLTNGRPKLNNTTTTKTNTKNKKPSKETESTSLLLPVGLWDIQLVIEFLLRELEAAEQLDMLGSWSGRVFIVNALNFTMETLFNGIFISGPAIVNIGVNQEQQHMKLHTDISHIPVVNFVPLDVMSKVAFGEGGTGGGKQQQQDGQQIRKVNQLLKLLLAYSQMWVCCVRNRTVLLAIEQERAICNSTAVGKCVIIDAITATPIRDSAASDWYLAKVGSALRAVGAETLESRAAKVRKTVFYSSCPLKGYPSTALLVTMLVVSWCLALGYILYPHVNLRPIAVPSATIIPLILADEFGFLNWCIVGDFEHKLSSLFWFLRHKVKLECNGKVMHEIRPQFRRVRWTRFVLRVLPTIWSVLMIWGAWTAFLPTTGPARRVSDFINLVFGAVVSVLLLFAWPLWGEHLTVWPFRSASPTATVAYIGRSEHELAPPKRFFRWCQVGGPFGVVPTFDGMMSFPSDSIYFWS